MNLKPCPYRQVDDDGHILCDKIKTGDREVSPNICRACPVAAIHCAHLRATLDHQARPPLTVRYGNGKTEIWDDLAPTITLQRAACAVKVTPILSPRDCAGCPLRQPLVAAEIIKTTDIRPPTTDTQRPSVRRAPRVAPAPVAMTASAPAAPPTPLAEARSSVVAQKIIQLQEWLAGHKTKPTEDTDAVMPLAVGARPARVPAEEKRVGWTD